jgi:class 3 adenylate cyclase
LKPAWVHFEHRAEICKPLPIGLVSRFLGPDGSIEWVSCVLGVFCAPVAHDNDAERAPHTTSMPRQRNSVQVWDVAWRSVSGWRAVRWWRAEPARPAGAPYTVTGEAVNLAARLTPHARRNQFQALSA